MKKVFFITFGTMAFSMLNAQEPADALRYAWLTTSGTARHQAIGGAMGSLGGDISSINVNPAGIGFFKTTDVVLTPGFLLNKNKSTYLGRTEKDSKNNFMLGTSGFVAGSRDYGGRNTKSSAFGIVINRTAGFSNNILYRGANNQSSYSQKFLEEIKNNNLTNPNAVANNYPFGTSLAFNTYWIDTASGGSGQPFTFKTRAPIATGLLQQNQIISKGGITEVTIAFASNYNDDFYVGGTIGIPLVNYNREATFIEADATENTTNKFNFASISENLETKGTGINLKLGVIFKPNEYVRLGLALHSPSFYVMTDKYSTSVTTDTEGYSGVLTQTSDFLSGSPAEFKYQLITPYRMIGSASYILGETQDVKKQKGFLTADIEFVNYKASSFLPDESNQNDEATKTYLKSLNKAIDKAQKSALNVRVGGELKFTTIMARAGAAYYGNPYKNINGEKGSRFLLSGGLGYRDKGMFVDLTYVHQISKDVHFPYRLQNSPFFGAAVKGQSGNVLLTFGFKI